MTRVTRERRRCHVRAGTRRRAYDEWPVRASRSSILLCKKYGRSGRVFACLLKLHLSSSRLLDRLSLEPCERQRPTGSRGTLSSRGGPSAACAARCARAVPRSLDRCSRRCCCFRVGRPRRWRGLTRTTFHRWAPPCRPRGNPRVQRRSRSETPARATCGRRLGSHPVRRPLIPSTRRERSRSTTPTVALRRAPPRRSRLAGRFTVCRLR